MEKKYDPSSSFGNIEVSGDPRSLEIGYRRFGVYNLRRADLSTVAVDSVRFAK